MAAAWARERRHGASMPLRAFWRIETTRWPWAEVDQLARPQGGSVQGVIDTTHPRLLDQAHLVADPVAGVMAGMAVATSRPQGVRPRRR